MISKVVPANSFYHTCRYITNKPGAEVLEVEGVRGHNYKYMAADFETQQQMRPSKEVACFHGILSFYPGENPSDRVMTEIAQKYLEQLGIVNTQYAISKHTDKAHLHLHIVANMVNNDGKSIRDSYIGLRGKKIAQKLTQEYKLVQALEKNLKLTHLENLSDTEANRYKVYVAISEILPHCRSMQELEARLLDRGIETQYKYKGHTNEKQGVSFKIENFCFKGSQVDRKFSFAGLGKLLDQKQKLVLGNETNEEEKVKSLVQSETQRRLSKGIPQLKASITKKKGHILNTSVNDGKGNELGNALEKAAQILFKTEETSQELPYELTQQGALRKKKKHSQRHRR
jgi:hypothetical protein